MRIQSPTQQPGTARPLRNLALIASLVALAGLFGCGRQPKRLEVYPATGKLTFAGKPPVGAELVLYPTVADPNHPRPTAVVGADGGFKVRTYGADDGAPPGVYKVTVQWFKPVMKGDEAVVGKNLLPERYSDPQKTDLKIEIAANPNQLTPLVLKR